MGDMIEPDEILLKIATIQQAIDHCGALLSRIELRVVPLPEYSMNPYRSNTDSLRPIQTRRYLEISEDDKDSILKRLEEAYHCIRALKRDRDLSLEFMEYQKAKAPLIEASKDYWGDISVKNIDISGITADQLRDRILSSPIGGRHG
jgi:hypothetical protein